MACPQIESVSQLAQELHLYWSLLDVAVRLERDWDTRLRTTRDDAFSAAMDLGRRIAGEASEIGTLADLRVFIAAKIQGTVELAGSTLAAFRLDVATVTVARSALDEARDIGSLLVRGVNIRDCTCTRQRAARRELMGRLVGNPVPGPLVDSAHHVARLACIEVTRRLKECIDVCAQSGSDAPFRLH